MTATTTTPKRRTRLSTMLQGKAAQFLALRAEVAQATKRQNEIKGYLNEQIDKFGEVDEVNGHINLTLPEPVIAGGKEYTILQRQKRVGMLFDEEVAERLLKDAGVYEKATTTVVQLDQDKVYALHQMGEITDEQMDEILVEKISWALVPLVEL